MAHVRRIETSEAPTIAAMWADYATELSEPSDGLTAEAAAAVTNHLVANATHPQATCLVADAGGTLVGFATAAVFRHPTMSGVLGDIEEIYVHPDHRRSGVGTALAQAILDWIDDHGGDVMKVRIGRGLGEETAIKFWESLGFESDMVECSLYPAADRVR